MEKDIESLRNKKIQEMEELLEIKNKKERSRNELEELRLDVYREKNLLDSLRHQRAAQETSLEHLRKVEAVKAAVSVSSAPMARVMPSALPLSLSGSRDQALDPTSQSSMSNSLRSESSCQGRTSTHAERTSTQQQIVRSEPPKLAHRLSLEQEQHQKHELAQAPPGQHHGEDRLGLEQGGLSDPQHSEARRSLEHAQSLAERALRLEQERRHHHHHHHQVGDHLEHHHHHHHLRHHQVGGHLDRKQDQRQAGEQMKREQVTVDSKTNLLQRRFSEADYARLGRMQGGVVF